MKKRSVQTGKKHKYSLEDKYKYVLEFSDTMNNVCDGIISQYDDLLKIDEDYRVSRTVHLINYMSSRIHIIRSLKKRLCKLYTITDHKDFVDEFDCIYLRYYEDYASFKHLIDYLYYIFTDNETKVVIISYNLAPLQCCLVGTDLQNNKSAYSLDLIKKWKG